MGNIVMGISPDSPIQQDLFDLNAEQIQKMRRLDEVIDRINRMHGSETIVIGAHNHAVAKAERIHGVMGAYWNPRTYEMTVRYDARVTTARHIMHLVA